MSHIHSSQIKLTLQILHLGGLKLCYTSADSSIFSSEIICDISLGPTSGSRYKDTNIHTLVSAALLSFQAAKQSTVK